MPIIAETVEHRRVYLAEFHNAPDGSAPLFHSAKNGRPGALSADTVSRVLKQAGDIARASCPEIPGRLHCHLIRKTRAMGLYQDGVPLPLIMQMLGHESMSTTSSFYAFATQQMTACAIKNATPPSLGQPAKWASQEVTDALYTLGTTQTQCREKRDPKPSPASANPNRGIGETAG